MKTLRDSVYALVAIGSLAMAVCQPSEAGVETSGLTFDQALTTLSSALQQGGSSVNR